jgi:hypothetical protein
VMRPLLWQSDRPSADTGIGPTMPVPSSRPDVQHAAIVHSRPFAAKNATIQKVVK